MYQFKVVPFRLMNAPSTLQSMMDGPFKEIPFGNAYLDDVVVVSKTLKKHIGHLKVIFLLIEKHKLHSKIAKGEFAKSEVCLPGHTASAAVVSVNLKK